MPWGVLSWLKSCWGGEGLGQPRRRWSGDREMTVKKPPNQSHAGPWPLHMGLWHYVLLWYRQRNGWSRGNKCRGVTKCWETISSGSVRWRVSLERPRAACVGANSRASKAFEKGRCSYSPCSRRSRGSPLFAKGRQHPAAPYPFYTHAKSGQSFFCFVFSFFCTLLMSGGLKIL